MNKDDYLANDCYTPIAIANGQAASAAIDLSGTDLCGIFFPAAMTGAKLTIQASEALNGVYREVQKDEAGGGAFEITVSAGKYAPITNLAITAGLRYIKLVSNATEAADRALVLATRPI